MANAVGVIGLGAMGLGMAKSLRLAGHEVFAYDVRAGVAKSFAAEGGRACETLAELGAACAVVVSAVVNAAQTEAVLFGDNAASTATTGSGCAAHMRPGSVFIMCSTVDPNWSAALELRLEAMGLAYLDSPMSGGAAKAATGDITLMTAGRPEVYAKCEDVLKAMAGKIYRLGDRAGAAARSRSSTSCWPGCTSPLPPKPWPWACARAWTLRRFTT